MGKTQKKDYLTLKVAKSLNLKSLGLGKADLIKAMYIINQINVFGDYSLYFNRMKTVMGLKSKQLTIIINKLIDNNIIQLIKENDFEEKIYSMVTPYDVDKDECDIKSFQFEAEGTPVFINRLIHDNFKLQLHSNYQPRKKEHNDDSSDKDQLIATLQAEVAELKKQLAMMALNLNHIIEIKSETVMAIVQDEYIKAGEDVETVEFCDGMFIAELEGFKQYNQITSSFNEDEKIDFTLSLLASYDEKKVNEFSITVQDMVLDFFTNATGENGFIQFKGYKKVFKDPIAIVAA